MISTVFFRLVFAVYFAFLSWQLLTPVTIISAGRWDKLYHIGSFVVLAALAVLAWRSASTKILAVILLLYGALTEILQHFIVGRSFSVADWLADSLGIIIGLFVSLYLLKRTKLFTKSAAL